MMLIQDIFVGGITEKIKTKLGWDNLLFHCSTYDEFINFVLKKIGDGEKYPFIFIPSGDNVSYQPSKNSPQEMFVKIDKIFLCTLSDRNLLADERDEISFRKILFPLKEILTSELLGSLGVSSDQVAFAYKQHHSYGINSETFEDLLDVIIVESVDFKLPIKKIKIINGEVIYC